MPLYRNRLTGDVFTIVANSVTLKTERPLQDGERITIMTDRQGRAIAQPQADFFGGDYVLTDNWGLNPAEVEQEAERIYNSYDIPPGYPWIPGGNSEMQEKARREARIALS